MPTQLDRVDGSAPAADHPAFVPPPPAEDHGPPPEQPVKARRNVALAALIVGIVALMLGWVPIIGVVLGALAIGFGIVALTRRQRASFAIWGLALGSWGLITSLLATAILAVIVAQPEEFREEFWASYSQAQAGELPVPPAEEVPAAPVEDDTQAAETAPESTDFAAIDDAGFAAVVADPMAALGETYIVYGEVQLLDESTGPCAALIAADDAQHSSWEGYTAPAWIYAESGEESCPEFSDLGALSHIKAWVTVVGTTATEWEDGTAEDLVSFALRRYEALPALP